MLKSYIRPKCIIKQSTSTTLNQITLQAMYSYHGSVVVFFVTMNQVHLLPPGPKFSIMASTKPVT